ncbi:hypothetical protein [Embleya sp. MST-111070]|uniref:hypothetical protein n=1 Tax=Embleya sp. MST-111070 TaxID=3398231 RepID=UPI003F7405A8
MTVRTVWHTATGQTRADTRLAPLGVMAPAGEMTSRPGVVAGGNPLKLTPVGTMTCEIGPGRAIVQGTGAQGAYPLAVTSADSVTITDGDAQWARIDTVALCLYDELYDEGDETRAAVEIVEGEPAAAPAPPNLPTSAIALWDITVPAGTSAGTGGIAWSSAVTDRRQYTAAYGGIIPPGTGEFAGSYTGQYRHGPTGLEVWDGIGMRWADPRPVPFARLDKANGGVRHDGLERVQFDIAPTIRSGVTPINKSGAPAAAAIMGLRVDRAGIYRLGGSLEFGPNANGNRSVQIYTSTAPDGFVGAVRHTGWSIAGRDAGLAAGHCGTEVALTAGSIVFMGAYQSSGVPLPVTTASLTASWVTG